jgi:chemotaxis protein methyltransferase CheR
VAALIDDLWQVHGLDYRGWSMAEVEAGARALIARDRLDDVTELRARLLDDRGCVDRLLTELAGPAGAPFGDVELARALRHEICPRLRTYASVRIWHVGDGDDPYTTAIVLREAGLLERSRIYVTASSETLLPRAHGSRGALARWSAARPRYRAAGGTASLDEYVRHTGDHALVREDLRERVAFAVHDFASDASFNEFHLVICRGVLARFGPTLRHRALSVIDASLRRLCYLALAPEESAQVGARPPGFETIAGYAGVLRKVA